MKMLLAIINYDDAHCVMGHLMEAGFQITKLATTGGFLRAGNVTVLIGLEDSRVEEAMGIIRKYCNTRTQMMPTAPNIGIGFQPPIPVEVSVGGATVFVLNVEQFEKL